MRDYNFFESCQRRKGFRINIKSPVFLGFTAILLIVIASGGIAVQNAIVKAELADATEKLAVIQASPGYQETVALQNSINSLNEYDRNASIALERIEAGKKILNTGFLKAVSGVIPSTVTLQTASLTSVNAAFSFRTPDRKTAAELVHDLDHSGLFLQTTLVSLTSDGSGGCTASINCMIKAGPVLGKLVPFFIPVAQFVQALLKLLHLFAVFIRVVGQSPT
jgi:hypothetical protein